MKRFTLLPFLTAYIAFFSMPSLLISQNKVGLGTVTPQARLHIKGGDDISQLIIDADTVQSGSNPLIRLRKSNGTDLLWIHADNPSNIFFGLNAGKLNDPVFGTGNIFIGSEAGSSNTNGGLNTAVGGGALENNTTGDDNTAIGRSTLNHNTAGIRNTALGGASLTFNTLGVRNTACGHYALHFNSQGHYNSAMGNEALYNNTTGAGNAAFGYQALYNNTTQIQNTSLGNETLLNTTANGNTALGFLAGHDFDNGDWNTYVGIYADANAGGFTNSTAIGSSTDVTASNQVRIGTGVTSIGGPQNWTNSSDGRIKVNVQADVPGLEFIKLLQPVTYNKSIALEASIIGNQSSQIFSADNTYENIRYSGFIAQDVEAAAQSIGYEFSGVDAPQNDKSLYGLRYAEFVVPLVKAVQEQQVLFEQMQKQLQQLQKENAELRQLILQAR